MTHPLTNVDPPKIGVTTMLLGMNVTQMLFFALERGFPFSFRDIAISLY
jgi:hypothetical protein